MHFDAEVAFKYSIVREEKERLWQQSVDKKDDCIATAAASAILFILYGSDAGEDLSTSESKMFNLDFYCSM